MKFYFTKYGVLCGTLRFVIFLLDENENVLSLQSSDSVRTDFEHRIFEFENC